MESERCELDEKMERELHSGVSGWVNCSDRGVGDMLKVLGKGNQGREYFLLIPPFDSRHRAINLVSNSMFLLTALLDLYSPSRVS